MRSIGVHYGNLGAFIYSLADRTHLKRDVVSRGGVGLQKNL